MKKSIWHRYQVTVVAMIVFGIITSFTTIIYEVLLAGATAEQWLGVRVIYNILRFAGAYFLGSLIEKVRLKFGRQSGFIYIALADAISLSIYQLPIYFISALIMQVSIKTMVITALLYILDNLIFGWLYGFIFDRTKILFSKRFKQQAII